ncbi:hypothetical protein ACFXNW_20725 [Nocardia sp. NPDC059180]|uniref:hypothetical protein n=1 Tax=Nocardia sp. NPDC059180 TaxID=3346761 RepID=UPI0036A27E7C
MRITVELPPELLQAANLAAAARGIRLEELFTRALTHEVGAHPRARVGGRVAFPLVRAADQGHLREITNSDIADVFVAEDIEKYT